LVHKGLILVNFLDLWLGILFDEKIVPEEAQDVEVIINEGISSVFD
jgi:hypothetical protein